MLLLLLLLLGAVYLARPLWKPRQKRRKLHAGALPSSPFPPPCGTGLTVGTAAGWRTRRCLPAPSIRCMIHLLQALREDLADLLELGDDLLLEPALVAARAPRLAAPKGLPLGLAGPKGYEALAEDFTAAQPELDVLEQRRRVPLNLGCVARAVSSP